MADEVASLLRRLSSASPARRRRAPRQRVAVVDEATGDGAQVDAAELALLQRMGLPTAFSTTKAQACSSRAQSLQRVRCG